jgi:hypothetical protein
MDEVLPENEDLSGVGSAIVGIYLFFEIRPSPVFLEYQGG